MYCNTCKIDIADEVKIAHYKSNWHSYNLKLAKLDIQPKTEQDFNTDLAKIINRNAQRKPTSFKCCGKYFKSEGTYNTHLSSKLHLKNENINENVEENHEINNTCEIAISKKLDIIPEDNDGAKQLIDVKIEEENEITENSCLFCDKDYNSIERNLKHMKIRHGFELPHRDLIDDLSGMMKALINFVTVDYACIECHREFDDLQSLRKHMLRRGHVHLDIDEKQLKQIIAQANNEDFAEDEEELFATDCFFCPTKCKSLEKNLNHMRCDHGFILPFTEYCIDLEGLVQYLADVLCQYRVCLECNKPFKDLNSVRKHMQHKNHKRLFFNISTPEDGINEYYEGLEEPEKIVDVDNEYGILPDGRKVMKRPTMIKNKTNRTKDELSSGMYHLAISDGKQSGAKFSGVGQMSVVRYEQRKNGQLVAVTRQDVKALHKQQDKVSRAMRFRESQFKNIQTYFRDANMIYM